MPSGLWNKLRKSKGYREEFVSAQAKRLIPLQIRRLLKQHKMSQEKLAELAGLTQGVVSRAANPEYGNLTLNTLVRIAAGFDIAFIGKFVPFSELDRELSEFSEDSLRVKTFTKEDEETRVAAANSTAGIGELALRKIPVMPTQEQGSSSRQLNAGLFLIKGDESANLRKPLDRETLFAGSGIEQRPAAAGGS